MSRWVRWGAERRQADEELRQEYERLDRALCGCEPNDPR